MASLPLILHDSNKYLKYARIEEERRFLLKSPPQGMLESNSFTRITDRYIEGTRLRLRRMAFEGSDTPVMKLGQKYQPDDLEAHQAIMTNIYINDAEYRVFNELRGTQINKKRYPFTYNRLHFSIDVFDGALSGLILAEIEGHTGVDISILPKPGFALQEVTGDTVFRGVNLARLTESGLKKILVGYGVI